MSVLAFDTIAKPASQPAPRTISGRAVERLCRRNDPVAAAALAVDLAAGLVVLTRLTPEQALQLTKVTASEYCAARKLFIANH